MSNIKLHKKENNIAGEIISRLHIAYAVDEKRGSLGALGDKIGISNSVISGWKARGVPEDKIARARIDTGYLETWIKTGKGSMQNAPPQQTANTHQTCENCINEQHSPYINKVTQMMTEMDTDTQKDICLSVEKEKLLRDLLRQQADKKAG